MARNGSGTYNLPAGNPVTTGTTISSTWANNTLSDMATALTGSLAADGQTTASGNLPMGAFAHTNVGNATVRNMYASAAQVQDNALTYLSSVSGTDTITAAAAVGMTAYATGQRFTFIGSGANTGAATININSIGAKSITKNGTTALAAGDIVSGAAVEVIYDGTRFQLVNPAATIVNTFSAGTTGFTPSTATSGAVTLAGTLGIANGGTNNAALGVTAGAIVYTDGSKQMITVAGTSGQVLTSAGSSAPTWSTLSLGGELNAIQYFTTAGTATYTATAGTSFIIVEVVGGGGGTSTAGGTSSFGAFCSATGGATNGNGGAGTGGDLNTTCPAAQRNSYFNGAASGTFTLIQAGSPGLLYGFGAGSSKDTSVTANSNGTSIGCGGGGYSRERIASGFSGTTVTVGAVGTGNGSGSAGTAGCVIVYEYK